MAPKVGSKKPNAFGLLDMHGSVAELTVNQYTEDGYEGFDQGKAPECDRRGGLARDVVPNRCPRRQLGDGCGTAS